MNHRNHLVSVASLLFLTALAMPPVCAGAQDAPDVAGTYVPLSNAPFGDNPRGQLILGRDGHYSLLIVRATLPKIAADARDKGTTEENKAIISGSIVHVGRYTVDADGKAITFNVEVSSFPNWEGSTFKRALKISGDEITYTNSAPSGGGKPFDAVWKRVQ